MSNKMFAGKIVDGAVTTVYGPRGSEEAVVKLAYADTKVKADSIEVVTAESKTAARALIADLVAKRDEVDEFAPTESELAEAAAAGGLMDEAGSTRPAVKAAKKTGTWYACGMGFDGSVVSEQPYSSADKALEAGVPDAEMIVAVQARSRDAALVTYDSLEDKKAQTEVAMARTTTPVAPLNERRSEPVIVGTYYVNKPGTVHAKEDCHFLRRSPAIDTITGSDTLTRLIAGEAIASDNERTTSKDGSYICLYCAMTTKTLVSA